MSNRFPMLHKSADRNEASSEVCRAVLKLEVLQKTSAETWNLQPFPAKRQRSANLILSSARQTRPLCFVLGSSHDSDNVLPKKKKKKWPPSFLKRHPPRTFWSPGGKKKKRRASNDVDGCLLKSCRCRNHEVPHASRSKVAIMKTSSPPPLGVSADGGEMKVTRERRANRERTKGFFFFFWAPRQSWEVK